LEAPPAAGGVAPADVLIVTASETRQPTLSARVNGVPMELIVALDGPRAVILNGDAAERAGVRANPVLSAGVSFSVGGDTLRGRTGRTGIRIDNGPRFRQRVIWFPEQQFTDEADGYIGAAAIRNLDVLSVELGAAEADTPTPVQPVRFEGRRGFEWRARVEAAPQPYWVTFSLIENSGLTARGARLLERRGLLAERDYTLRLTSLWFIRDTLAFSHENIGLSINGLRPQRFARFARAEEVAAHRDRLAFEAEHGPIEAITVRGSSTRPDEDPITITLGRDFLLQCLRIEFDYRSDAITAHCPVHQDDA
jgi:hypothetical protein